MAQKFQGSQEGLTIDKIQNNINEDISKLQQKTPNLKEKEILISYYNTLIKSISKEEALLVNNRIQDVKIRHHFLDCISTGTYNHAHNEITYLIKSSIGHEFLHLASSYYNKEKQIGICEFRIQQKNFSFGRGLNEGYTELLASRFFNKKNKITSYYGLANTCKIFELFFDKPEDMRKLYFSGNLNGFITKLRTYFSKEEIYEMLFEMEHCVSKYPKKTISLLYERFNTCIHDSDKITKMNQIINENKIIKSIVKAKQKRKIQSKSIYTIAVSERNTYIRKAVTTISLLCLLQTFNPKAEKLLTELANVNRSITSSQEIPQYFE